MPNTSLEIDRKNLLRGSDEGEDTVSARPGESQQHHLTPSLRPHD